MIIAVTICSLLLAASPLANAAALRVREGRPTVEGVYVNGHGPYTFLVDTGTNVNLIETRIANEIGLTASFQVDLESAIGKTRMLGSEGSEVSLDSVKANGQIFLFSALEAIHGISPNVQGVLGQWFLSRFDYLLDLRGKCIEFGKQRLNGMRTQVTMVNGRTTIPTNLGDLVLDSGATRLVLFRVAPHRVGDASLRTVTGAQFVGMVFSELIIGGRKIWHGDAVAMPKQAELGVAGLMPASFFKTIYVCNSEGYVVLE